jgi:hypothetical protein
MQTTIATLRTSHTGREYSALAAFASWVDHNMLAKNRRLTISRSIKLNIHLTNCPYRPLLFIQGRLVSS